MVFGVAQVIVVAVLLMSVAGFFGELSKYLELTSHFKLQYLIVTLCCLFVFIASQAWAWTIGSVLVALVNLAVLLPWYFPSAAGSSNLPTNCVRLLLANVDHENTQYMQFIELVQEVKPDMVITQEVTHTWVDHLTALRHQFPYERTAPQPHGWGIALYSRVPVEHSEVIGLGRDRRPAIQARLDLGGRPLCLLAVHPRAPLRRNYFHHRNEQLAEASAIIRGLSAPKVLVGDLNASLWSPHLVRLVRETGLCNARQGFGILPTWPTYLAGRPWLMIPIDHCLVSQDIRVVNVKTGPNIGSDHLPLMVDLAIPSAANRRDLDPLSRGCDNGTQVTS
jgi:endonuclease/exonuclease/phosphatase (EEP) superfamily protein YafD